VHKVGFLYPGFGAEDDYPRAQSLLGPDVALRLVHTSVGEDAHRVDALLDLGAPQRLAEGARELRGAVDSVMWACTSGSFVFGWEGAREQVRGFGQALGIPASSTSFAFVNATRALGVRRVAVAATYPEEVSSRFVEFLQRGEIEVLGMLSNDVPTAAGAGALDREQVFAMVKAVDRADAEALLVPDTALHSIAWLDELERTFQKPVLTANQVTIWEGLRLAGGRPLSAANLGTLFRASAAAGSAFVDPLTGGDRK
jgi:maleate cis-trans isomerase